MTKSARWGPYPGVITPPSRNSSVAGLGIDASWEPDFFGRLKAKKQSAAHNLAAQHAALYSTWVTLSAETAPELYLPANPAE